MVANAAEEDKRPASRRVADELAAQIESGELAAGASLPTYRQLAEDFDVAVNTAMAAVRLLRDEGVVTIKTNAGARVRDRTEDVDIVGELRRASSDVRELRSELQRLDTNLSDLETRLAILVDHVNEGE